MEILFDRPDFDIPDYIDYLDNLNCTTKSRRTKPIGKTKNKTKKVGYSHLGNFITYKNENKIGRIAIDKLGNLQQYLYAYMIEGFNLDYRKIADNTFIHKSDLLEDTLLCVLNKRTLYILAIEQRILFSINLDNHYVNLETYDFRENIRYFFKSDDINKEKYFYSTLEYIVNKMRSAYGLRANINFSQNKCELEFVNSNFLDDKDNFATKVPTFFNINLSKKRKLDADFNNELKYLRDYKNFIKTLPNKSRVDEILTNYDNAQGKFIKKLDFLKSKNYIDSGEIKEYFGYIYSSTDTENTFIFREFDSTSASHIFYYSKQEAKNRIESAISENIAKFRDDSEELINSYREFIETSGLINNELLKDIYLGKLDSLQSNLMEELNKFDDQQYLTVV